MIEFDRILHGEKPSFVFREILLKNVDLRKNDIGPLFKEHFLKIDSFVVNSIWKWKDSEESYGGINDDRLDEDVLIALKDAGYIL